ncbi:TrmH family RNA methyltransferase [Garciella nitratireducens]|uniref:RNA methyltransferase, TrmH family n=1 Tax=Garciella nitratireducens DSM 15102 TaxID=1121911 RepID=A0A1T4K358_9FIRM|nr:RNA methyltransferase [Garciella nitratireducens]RBP46645.1 TrmH family RNA methyltransferase [Garciella nitratireducens]SJZ36871.1 RNA methyltransferase, TrmH family [Garciella nitratireducens DSM 15102]
MLEKKIISVQNFQYKEWKKLHQKKYRNQKRKYFIEGIKMLEEAIKWNNSFEAILYSSKLFDVNGGKELYQKLLKIDIPIFELKHTLFKELCFTENSQGIMAVLKQPSYFLKDVLDEDFSSIIVLENIQDPGNLGTIIRTADAAGFNAVFLSKGCVDLYNDKTLRATMGSFFHLPIVQGVELERFICDLIEKEYQVVGSSLHTDYYYHKVEYSKKKALIIGNESHGISQAVEKLCTNLVKVPILGHAESLNAAIAAGILMYKMQGV